MISFLEIDIRSEPWQPNTSMIFPEAPWKVGQKIPATLDDTSGVNSVQRHSPPLHVNHHKSLLMFINHHSPWLIIIDQYQTLLTIVNHDELLS